MPHDDKRRDLERSVFGRTSKLTGHPRQYRHSGRPAADCGQWSGSKIEARADCGQDGIEVVRFCCGSVSPKNRSVSYSVTKTGDSQWMPNRDVQELVAFSLSEGLNIRARAGWSQRERGSTMVRRAAVRRFLDCSRVVTSSRRVRGHPECLTILLHVRRWLPKASRISVQERHGLVMEGQTRGAWQ